MHTYASTSVNVLTIENLCLPFDFYQLEEQRNFLNKHLPGENQHGAIGHVEAQRPEFKSLLSLEGHVGTMDQSFLVGFL